MFHLFSYLDPCFTLPELGSGVLLRSEGDEGSPYPLFKELGTNGGTCPADIIFPTLLGFDMDGKEF